jgi:flagellar basal body L-ring protein FlgH
MPCKRITSLSLLAVLALAGCSTSAPDKAATPEKAAATPAAAVTSDGRCDSDLAKFAVGQPANAALLQQAQQRSGAQTARVLRPGDIVTLEYRSERLNLNVDAKGTVSRVNCG